MKRLRSLSDSFPNRKIIQPLHDKHHKMKLSRPKNLTFSWKLTFANATKSNILRLQYFIFCEFAKSWNFLSRTFLTLNYLKINVIIINAFTPNTHKLIFPWKFSNLKRTVLTSDNNALLPIMFNKKEQLLFLKLFSIICIYVLI